MRIDHVAIAVEDLESAVKQYVDALGITDIEYETVESEKVKVAILKMENASIELMASTGDGPIKKFLDTRGSGLHHVALETPDIDGQVSKMESCGVKILGGVRSGSRGTRITIRSSKVPLWCTCRALRAFKIIYIFYSASCSVSLAVIIPIMFEFFETRMHFVIRIRATSALVGVL